MTLKDMARITGCAPSIVHAWSTGSSPCESMISLKRLCDHVETSLSFALSGEEQKNYPLTSLQGIFFEEPLFDGYAKILITKLVRKGSNIMIKAEAAAEESHE
jgi:hypothetical protein